MKQLRLSDSNSFDPMLEDVSISPASSVADSDDDSISSSSSSSMDRREHDFEESSLHGGCDANDTDEIEQSMSAEEMIALMGDSTPTLLEVDANNTSPSVPPLPLISPASSSSKHKAEATNFETPNSSPRAVMNVPIRNIQASSSPSSASSFASNLSDHINPTSSYFDNAFTTASYRPRPRHNGWSVPLGVHKVICAEPGLKVTTQVHRQSLSVKINCRGRVNSVEGPQELIISPGSYIEVLETQVHGDRVRGRICWEEEEECSTGPSEEEKKAKKKKKKGIKKVAQTQKEEE